MNSQPTKLAVISAVVLVALAQTAGGAVLWDQSDYDVWGAGFYNAESGAPPFGMTVFSVNHITVDNVWLVDSITTYYSALDPVWGDGIAQGYLHVFGKTDPLPVDGTDDPTASPLVTMSGTLDGDHIVVTASGLNLSLEPGEYWIGITPIAASGPFGPEIHLSSLTLMGDATASYDPFAFPGPPAWINFNPGVDASILIEGVITVANQEMTWGGIKSLYKE